MRPPSNLIGFRYFKRSIFKRAKQMLTIAQILRETIIFDRFWFEYLVILN